MVPIPNLSAAAVSGVSSAASQYAFDGSNWNVSVPSGGVNFGGASSGGLSPILLIGAGLAAWFLLRRR